MLELAGDSNTKSFGLWAKLLLSIHLLFRLNPLLVTFHFKRTSHISIIQGDPQIMSFIFFLVASSFCLCKLIWLYSLIKVSSFVGNPVCKWHSLIILFKCPRSDGALLKLRLIQPTLINNNLHNLKIKQICNYLGLVHTRANLMI